ncbi:PhzF family phenazine biosynthesis protein [Fontibacillus phaseoli]|uniref:PhzF family phenazine biosynthesis protein n=1 Tax=Fontibacillus phaseoli TaxID=1416533 RepID=A0A369BP76_9BACL|nr:PhzF family phenazine biosynthesis protein [Fontibacillus phaseoli]RCX22875.1 PhzF family phenazine biosynthesis protein [Fontibacillus phaseoli]
MKYYVVDAFTKDIFKGNPAGVCIVSEFPDTAFMQNIAYENNLSETAFVVPRDGYFDLKWFTPELEIDLCGHATLASAYVIHHFFDQGLTEMNFHTLSGILKVVKKDDLFELNFPARIPEKIDSFSLIEEILGGDPEELYVTRNQTGTRYYAVLENEERIAHFIPDFELIKKLPDSFGLVITAKGKQSDFVSRFFAPHAGVDEDPVTGSVHCTLIPYWAGILEKDKLLAKQLSKRGGILYCENLGARVAIGGHAVLYLEGSLNV